MAFIHVSGPARVEGFPKVASTTIQVGAVVGFHASGFVSHAVAASTVIVGVSQRQVASGNDDYAQNSLIPVIIPGPDDTFEADVIGTAVQSDVGEVYDLNQIASGTAQSVDRAASASAVVTVVGFISSSKLLVKFNGFFGYAKSTTT